MTDTTCSQGTNYAYWTPNGQLAGAINGVSGSGQTNLAYTDGGLLTSGDDGPNRSYDPMGRPLSISYNVAVSIYASTRTVTYNWNQVGQLTSKLWTSSWGIPSQTISYAYDPNTGLLSQQTNQNNTRTQYTYDNLMREATRTHQRRVSGAWTNFDAFSTIYRTDGLVSNLMRTVPSQGAYAYNYKELYYDFLGRMTEEDTNGASGFVSAYQNVYDNNGNRTRMNTLWWDHSIYSWHTMSYDAANQLTQYDSDSFVPGTDFDANGNQVTAIGGGYVGYTYYADNRMSGQYYLYDGRVAGVGTAVYTYDGHERLFDNDDSAPSDWPYPTTAEYLGGDLMLEYSYAPGYNGFTGDTLMWMHLDPLGSLADTSDVNGVVTGLATNNVDGTNAQINGSPSGMEFQWNCSSGYSCRPSVKLYQVENRTYDPAQGRFLQQDPLTFGEGDWTHAANSPANAVDPTGLAAGKKKVVWWNRLPRNRRVAWEFQYFFKYRNQCAAILRADLASEEPSDAAISDNPAKYIHDCVNDLAYSDLGIPGFVEQTLKDLKAFGESPGWPFGKWGPRPH